MARGDIPFLMLMKPGLTLALRTPFQRMPKETERAKYMRALDGGRVSLPYGLEVWAPKRVLDIEWDDAGSVALIGYDPGEWEQAIKAVTSGRTRDGAAPLHSGNLWHLLYAWIMAQDQFSRRTSAEIAGGKSVMFSAHFEDGRTGYFVIPRHSTSDEDYKALAAAQEVSCQQA